jgi:hypothetical protein
LVQESAACGGNRPIPEAKLKRNPGGEPGDEILVNRVRRSGLALFDVRSRGHGDNDVLSHFVIRPDHAKEELVLVDAKFRPLSDGQKHGMLVALRPNAVRKTLRLEGIFLAIPGTVPVVFL